MLHEVVLALNGTSGKVLHQITQMVQFQALIHPSEKALLIIILELSDNYKFLKKFIDAVPMIGNNPIEIDENQLMPGMYLRAFCDGLYEGLEPYRQKIVNLEKFILDEPYAPLTAVVSKIESFAPLVDTLKALVKQIITRQIHGCKILQLVHTHMPPGRTMVATALARITQKCHQVMLKQLTSWMLYGNLVDPYKEFFIQTASDGTNGLQTSFSTLDSESLPDMEYYEQSVFKLVIEFLPSYIPMSLANKALFIGNTIILFSRESLDKNTGERTTRHESVYTETEMVLLNKLHALQSSSKLDIDLLENMVDDVRSCVTKHFWTLAKEVADVYGQLKLCKDVYLLGQGEMFVVFLRKAAHILQMPLTTHSNRDLNQILQVSARTCFNNETVLDKFYFNLPSKDSVAAGTTVWSVLKLEFNVTWPLHLLFTPAVINSYNTLFHFLLKVKKVELILHDIWIAFAKNKSKQSMTQKLQIYNILMFLVQNLQCYLQLDVLDSQDSIFYSMLKRSNDFEQITQAHNSFLANVINQAFLQTTVVTLPGQPSVAVPHRVNTLITHILELSEEFCSEVLDGFSEEKLNEIYEKLESLISLLMSIMVNMSSQASGNHLSKLLLKLDYNMYFSNKRNESSLSITT